MKTISMDLETYLADLRKAKSDVLVRAPGLKDAIKDVFKAWNGGYPDGEKLRVAIINLNGAYNDLMKVDLSDDRKF